MTASLLPFSKHDIIKLEDHFKEYLHSQSSHRQLFCQIHFITPSTQIYLIFSLTICFTSTLSSKCLIGHLVGLRKPNLSFEFDWHGLRLWKNGTYLTQ